METLLLSLGVDFHRLQTLDILSYNRAELAVAVLVVGKHTHPALHPALTCGALRQAAPEAALSPLIANPFGYVKNVAAVPTETRLHLICHSVLLGTPALQLPCSLQPMRYCN